MEMAERYEHIAAELIDALQNDTLYDFIGFNYEEEKRNKEFQEKLKKDNERLQQLVKMLQTVKKKIGKLNKIYLFKIFNFYLY